MTSDTQAGRTVEMIRASLPEAARDIKLNVQSVLEPGGPLSEAQRWGVALASAISSRSPLLSQAIATDAASRVDASALEDARAAASLMAMTNVYYRFRHQVGKPAYSERPARLRMNRLAKPAGSRLDMELFSLAASAVNGCEACVRAHEKSVLEGGLTEEHVHDAVRIASVIHAAAVALELGPSVAFPSERGA